MDLDCSYQKWAKENEGHEICICYWWSTVFALFARLGITRTFKTCQHNVRPSLACRAPIVQIGLENEITLVSLVIVKVSEAKNWKKNVKAADWMRRMNKDWHTKYIWPWKSTLNLIIKHCTNRCSFLCASGEKGKLRWKGIWMAKSNKREDLNLVGLV